MRRFLLISVVCLGLLNVPQAYADFEGVETTLSQLEGLQRKAKVLQQKYEKIQAAYNAVRQGNFGALGGIAGDLGINKIGIKMPSGIADKLKNGNIGDLQKSIVGTTLTKKSTKQNQIEEYQEAKAQNDALMRADLARLYAYAFTLRTNLAKERAEKKDDLDPSEDKRDMLKKANEEAMEFARRLNQVVDMQSSMEEFTLRLMTRTLSAPDDEEEGEAK